MVVETWEDITNNDIEIPLDWDLRKRGESKKEF